MAASGPIIFEETVCYLLAKVTTAFRSAMERHLGEIGLHSGQTFALIELWSKDGIRPIDLARRLNLKPPTITTMLKGLEQKKLVRLEKTDGDARSIRVFLTGEGKLIRHEVERRWADVEAECVGPLKIFEEKGLLDILKRLRCMYTGQEFIEDEE